VHVAASRVQVKAAHVRRERVQRRRVAAPRVRGRVSSFDRRCFSFLIRYRGDRFCQIPVLRRPGAEGAGRAFLRNRAAGFKW
jgi:hypothetical protein